MQKWLHANCPGFIETLQIYTHWSGLSHSGRHAGSLISRPADHLGKVATRTHQQGGGQLNQVLDCCNNYQW